MSAGVNRRRRRTWWIYGTTGIAIVVWWLILDALGVTESTEGKVLLGVVAAGTLATALVRDPFGILCAIVFVLPFSYGILQFEIGVITLNPYTVGIITCLVIALAAAAMGLVRYRIGIEEIVVLLLGASFLLSTLMAPDLIEAGFLAFHGIFIPIATYFALRILVRSGANAEKVLVAYVAGATVFAVYGIVQFAQSSERLYILNLPPISAAAVMTTALITLVYSGWWRSRLGRIAGTVLVIGVLTTFSRGYLVLLLLTPFFFRAVSRGRAGLLMSWMLVASLFGTLVFAGSYELFYVENIDREHEQTAQRISDLQYWMSSLAARAQYYSIGLEQFAESPVIGNGFHRGIASGGVGSVVVWHNFHVEWLEYGGVIAYALYATLLVMHFRGVGLAARRNRVIAAGLTVIFTVLLNGLTNSFTAGVSPVLGFLFMALNRAQLNQGPALAVQPLPGAARPGAGGR